MDDFQCLYLNLERLGPGSDMDTRRALNYLHDRKLRRILDIGCGTGPATRLLLRETTAQVVALDDYRPNIEALMISAGRDGTLQRLETCVADMAAIPYPDASFDCLWAEGSAYVMGFSRALEVWKSLLAANGCLVISDLVWQEVPIPEQARDFWQTEYPDMSQAPARRRQIEAAGYTLLADFELSEVAWEEYYRPLSERLKADPQLAGTPAGLAVASEIGAWQRDRHYLAYTCFIAANR